jgi:hypothetical protein
MKTYVITAAVATVSLKTLSDGTWNGSAEIPEFKVNAESRYEAVALAEEIIDPLSMAPATKVTAEEEPPVPSAALTTLGTELLNAADALNGDSNDAEHDALYSLASTVAGVLGVDLASLLEEGGL